MTPLIPLKQITSVFLVAFGLTCFGLSKTMQGVSPAPDGGYPGGNTAEGQKALFSLTTGGFNTAVGWLSLETNTTGQFNTGVGAGTLALNTGDENTASGTGALLLNTTGTSNTANGALALFHNTVGIQNTASGGTALFSNTTGDNNTAIGISALFTNATGSANTASGYKALISNTTGNENTAMGASALFSNTTADQNTAIGTSALTSNTTGAHNTATGYQALMNNINGVDNTATGLGALAANTTGAANTAVGAGALQNNTTGDENVALGTVAGVNATGSFNVYIGAGENGVAGESNACYIASIFNQTSANGVPVLINSNDKLGTMTSSRRFKQEIKPINGASEALFALKPVTFRYKKEIDPAGTSQFGLVAEEVEKVNPDLIVRDKQGKPYSVRYDQVNAMLLNEFLKEHRKVEKLEATVAKQHEDFEAALADLKGQIQKVSAQLQLNKTAPQTVLNNR